MKEEERGQILQSRFLNLGIPLIRALLRISTSKRYWGAPIGSWIALRVSLINCGLIEWTPKTPRRILICIFRKFAKTRSLEKNFAVGRNLRRQSLILIKGVGENRGSIRSLWVGPNLRSQRLLLLKVCCTVFLDYLSLRLSYI